MRASLAAVDRANRKTLAVVSVSGGKDSTATALLALDMRVIALSYSLESVSRHVWRLLLATGCALAMAANARAADVWVVTDRQHPVKAAPGIRVIELDAPARIEAELATQLPPDAKRAAAIVQQRLKDGGTELHRRLANAYQGVTDAWSLGITKIPAVVVDRRYVVYGEVDVNRAVSRIERHRRAQP